LTVSQGFEKFDKLIGFRSAIEPNCYDGLSRAIVAAKRYRAAESGSRHRRDLLPVGSEGGFDRSLDDFRRTIGLPQNQFVLIALIRPRVRLGNNLLGGLLGDFRKVVRHRLAP
jgi:hypothetical protein